MPGSRQRLGDCGKRTGSCGGNWTATAATVASSLPGTVLATGSGPTANAARGGQPGDSGRTLRAVPAARMAALVAYLRYAQHLPVSRLARLLRELHEVALSTGTVENLCRRVARHNRAEQALRMKISGCFRTMEGACRFADLRSLIETDRKQGRDLLAGLLPTALPP